MCTNPIVLKVVLIFKIAVKVICIAVPIVLIVSCMLKMTKAITSNEEDVISVLKKLKGRLIATIVVFLTPTFVSVIMGMISSNLAYESCWQNCEDVSYHAQNYIYEFITNAGDDYTLSDVKKYRAYLKYIDDKDIREQYRQSLEEMTQNKTPVAPPAPTPTPGIGGGGTYVAGEESITGSNVTALNKFVNGSEGASPQCTVAEGPAIGEAGCKVDTRLNDGKLSISYGMTDSILPNVVESNGCFSDSRYYYYYKKENFLAGKCIPNASLEGALYCTFKGGLSIVKNSFNSKCNDFDFDKMFSVNQIHALLDKAHGGVGIMQSTIQAYCDKWNATKDPKAAADAFFYKNYEIGNGNCYMPGGQGPCVNACAYMARRDCEAELFFDGTYECNAYTKKANKSFKYPQYLQSEYKYCAGQ